MGQALLRLAAETPDVDVVAAVQRKVGQRVVDGIPYFAASELHGVPAFDAAVDFSLPEAFDAVLALCEERGAGFVSGTTGLSEAQRAALEAASARIPVLWTANFSLGVAVLDDRVRHWNALGEAALCEGRPRVVRGIARDPQAQVESLPPFVPAPVRGGLRWLARDAVRRLDRKYAALAVDGSLRRALLRMREALAASGGEFLLGRFGYADIAMCVVLECVAPIARTTPPLGPATRRHWRDEALAREFEDLLAWRRRLLALPGIAGSQFRDSG